jgi:hypothetical protein
MKKFLVAALVLIGSGTTMAADNGNSVKPTPRAAACGEPRDASVSPLGPAILRCYGPIVWATRPSI